MDEASVNVLYSAISITAPILGVISGGIVTNRLGGYESPRVVKALFITSIFVNFI